MTELRKTKKNHESAIMLDNADEPKKNSVKIINLSYKSFACILPRIQKF